MDALPFLAVAVLMTAAAAAFRGLRVMDKPAALPLLSAVLFLSVEGMLACVPPVGEATGEAAGRAGEAGCCENAGRAGAGREGAAAGCSKRGYCTACFTGVYPVAIPPSFGRDKFMEGFDPLNLTQADPVADGSVVEKEHDHTWEQSHEA